MNRAWARIYLDEWIEKRFAFFFLPSVAVFNHCIPSPIRNSTLPFPFALHYLTRRITRDSSPHGKCILCCCTSLQGGHIGTHQTYISGPAIISSKQQSPRACLKLYPCCPGARMGTRTVTDWSQRAMGGCAIVRRWGRVWRVGRWRDRRLR